jgi:hypothetical protein
MIHYDFMHCPGGDTPTGIWQVWHVNFEQPKLVLYASANSGTELRTKECLNTGKQCAYFKLHNTVTFHMCKMQNNSKEMLTKRIILMNLWLQSN